MRNATHDRHVERTRLALGDGQWWTLAELSAEVGCSEAAASARIRDLRKAAYGSHRILCRHTGPGGLHKYRMVPEREGMSVQ